MKTLKKNIFILLGIGRVGESEKEGESKFL